MSDRTAIALELLGALAVVVGLALVHAGLGLAVAGALAIVVAEIASR